MNPSDVNSVPDPASVCLDLVKRKVEAMRFGSVQIVVHDGSVITVEAIGKTCLPSSQAEGLRQGLIPIPAASCCHCQRF